MEAKELRDHAVALVRQLSDEMLADLQSDRDKFLEQWWKIAEPDQYMATSHSVFDPDICDLRHCGGWMAKGGPLAHPLGYRQGWDWFEVTPLQDVRLCPEPLRSPRDGLRNWQKQHLPTYWKFMVLDIDASDVANAGETIERHVLPRLKSWHMPDPWCVVDSGSGGVHIWWAFDVPQHRGGDPKKIEDYSPATLHAAKLHEVQLLQRHLAAVLHGDPAQLGIRQSFRLPGTINPKWHKADGQLRLCRIREASWKKCSISDFRNVPCVLDWRPQYERSPEGLPEWTSQLLRELGVRITKTKDGLSTLDRCPGCGGLAKAFIIHESATLHCHKPSCEYGE